MSTNDTWTCHLCGSNNTTANSPEQCPLCPHKKCSECKVGRPKALTFLHGHHSLPRNVDLGIKKVIGVNDEEDLGLDVSVYGNDALVHVVKNGVEHLGEEETSDE